MFFKEVHNTVSLEANNMTFIVMGVTDSASSELDWVSSLVGSCRQKIIVA
jgi:hypothetical protein